MLAIKWSLVALIRGHKPHRRRDHSQWPTHDPRATAAGDAIRKGLVVWIQGDLIEQSTTFGLRGLG
eukprot:7384614-Pyramimonas_sp.AAC.1